MRHVVCQQSRVVFIITTQLLRDSLSIYFQAIAQQIPHGREARDGAEFCSQPGFGRRVTENEDKSIQNPAQQRALRTRGTSGIERSANTKQTTDVLPSVSPESEICDVLHTLGRSFNRLGALLSMIVDWS